MIRATIDKSLLLPLIEQGLSTHKIAALLGLKQKKVWENCKFHRLIEPAARKLLPACLACGNQVNRSDKTFCNGKCQQAFFYKQNIEAWLKGELPGGSVHRVSHFVRRWLHETYGSKCMSPACGWDWSKPCTVEVEHKDGDHLNHRPENLMLLCPNCHANTPTYKNKNKGHGRPYRK